MSNRSVYKINKIVNRRKLKRQFRIYLEDRKYPQVYCHMHKSTDDICTAMSLLMSYDKSQMFILNCLN